MKRLFYHLRLLFLLLGATFLASGQPASMRKPVETALPSKRIPIAILGFENKTGDVSADWGKTALYGLLFDELREAKALRILRDGE